MRLYPPGSTKWFIELITVPESELDLDRKDIRLVTSKGHFSLCSFGFLSLAEFEPVATPFGIAIARPETMALANLLHHPAISDQTMSGLIAGRRIKRSNKDIGRVLALARLAEAREEDTLQRWPAVWAAALQSGFPTTWPKLIPRLDAGLRQLLSPQNRPDLEEAHHSASTACSRRNRPPSPCSKLPANASFKMPLNPWKGWPASHDHYTPAGRFACALVMFRRS